jgi:hypothetical protein
MATLVPAASFAASGADTTPPSAPQLVYVDGFQCLEVFLMYQQSTDNADPQSAIRYEAYADGEFIGSLGNHTRGFAYALHPGASSLTVKAIDSAGNVSRPSNPLVATTSLWPC